MLNEVFMTVADAAIWFQVSPKTIRTWVARYGVRAVAGRGKQARIYKLTDLSRAEMQARGVVSPKEEEP